MASPADRQDLFRRIYEARYGAIAAYARRRVDHHDADDVVAETFLVAWRRLSDIPQGEGTLPWLYGVARKVISQRRRGARRGGMLLARLARVGPVGDVAISESDLFDMQEPVHQALVKLRPQDQELLRLSEWEDLAPAQLAVIYECSVNAVTIRLHRARRRFGQALQAVEAEPVAHREGSA